MTKPSQEVIPASEPEPTNKPLPENDADLCDLCGELWRSDSCCYWSSNFDAKLRDGIVGALSQSASRSPSTPGEAPEVQAGRKLRGIRIHEIVFTVEDGEEHDKWQILDAVCTLAVGALNAARAVDGLEADPATRNWPIESPRPTSPVAPELTERCVVCGGPKNRDNIAGEERVLGWPYCVNPKCEAFQEPVASASWLPSPSERRRAELYAAYEEAAGDPAFSVHEADSVQPMPNSSTPSEQKPPQIASPSVADAMLDDFELLAYQHERSRQAESAVALRAAREAIRSYVTQLRESVLTVEEALETIDWLPYDATYLDSHPVMESVRKKLFAVSLRSPSTGKELKNDR